jgi:hypothetical protein
MPTQFGTRIDGSDKSPARTVDSVDRVSMVSRVLTGEERGISTNSQNIIPRRARISPALFLSSVIKVTLFLSL